jgi:hypothetical protein
MHKNGHKPESGLFLLQADSLSHESRKLLIFIGLKICLFSEQANRSLDLQGLGTVVEPLSTKLSTENLDDL